MLPEERCFTCGKPIGDKYEKYVAIKSQGKSASEAFAELGIERYCCKRMWLGYADLSKEIKSYPRF